MTPVSHPVGSGCPRYERLDRVAGNLVTRMFAALESFFIAMPGMDRDNTVLRRIALVHRMTYLGFPLVPVSRIGNASSGVPLLVIAGAPFFRSSPRAEFPRREAVTCPATPVQP